MLRLLLAGLTVVTLVAGLLGGKPHSAPQRPNILFILADDLGYGDLSAYGATDLHTPHIDSLMRAGVRFTNFYANSPVCSPSRAALLSGQYPEQMGVPGVIRDDTLDSWGYLRPGPLLSDRLRQAGYRTALVGKWHLGLEAPNLPNQRGFDEFYGLLEGMVDDYYAKLRHGQNFMRQNARPIQVPGHATDVFADAAVTFLQKQRSARPIVARPFFLYLAFTAPHDPLQPPATYLQRVLQRQASLRQPGIDTTRAKLVGLIEHLDDAVGRVLGTLRSTGLARNTIVVFTSDNGGWQPGRANCGPFRGYKGSMYEGGLRIPAGVCGPGVATSGVATSGVATAPKTATLQLMDWFPTLLDMANVAVPTNRNAGPLPARSFRKLLENSALDTLPGQHQRPLYFVRREGYDTYKGSQVMALRLGDWKLLQPTPFAPYELYNLRLDPREQRNVFGQDRALTNALVNRLMEHQRRAGAVPWQRLQGTD